MRMRSNSYVDQNDYFKEIYSLKAQDSFGRFVKHH